MRQLNDSNVTELIQKALQEDLNTIGDVTSIATMPVITPGNAHILAKEEGVIAGGFMVERVFSIVDAKLKVDIFKEDGSIVKIGEKVISISGPSRSILTGERTALNFLCRLSGIATLTAKFVEHVKNSGIKILDTRKTTPGLRALEKYAVRMGGGFNHRYGLYDMILIKENHIAAAGGIREAIMKCHQYLENHNLQLKIEVETKHIDEVKQALALNVDRIMLDNMNISQIKEAVALIDKRVEVEISGGVNLKNISDYRDTGVDYISIGGLTHSAKALDFSLLID